MYSRYAAFAKVFRGREFFDKSTGNAIPKFMIFATYFQSEYTTDGEEVRFISMDKQAKFDQIVVEYCGNLVYVNRHPYYGIRDISGWDNGIIKNSGTFFMRAHPNQTIVKLKDAEGIV
jgi:hypothetical protein